MDIVGKRGARFSLENVEHQKILQLRVVLQKKGGLGEGGLIGAFSSSVTLGGWTQTPGKKSCWSVQ